MSCAFCSSPNGTPTTSCSEHHGSAPVAIASDTEIQQEYLADGEMSKRPAGSSGLQLVVAVHA